MISTLPTELSLQPTADFLCCDSEVNLYLFPIYFFAQYINAHSHKNVLIPCYVLGSESIKIIRIHSWPSVRSVFSGGYIDKEKYYWKDKAVNVIIKP